MWTFRAPSNIALIKYMGKDEEGLPENPSLSYTLHNYWTEVSLEQNDTADVFVNGGDFSQSAVDRFLNHLNYIKKTLGYKDFFSIRSYNNFPHSAGIASSASSFAALTACVVKAVGADISAEQIADISRKGSGSSCRSFFSPWCLWDRDKITKPDIRITQLLHDLILIDSNQKPISSSAAHKLVKTSLLYEGRAQRAEQRLRELISAMNNEAWHDAYQLCWEECADMHALFETSRPHFRYIQPKTLEYLGLIDNFWRENKDGPIATIDAGANIHLLWRSDQCKLRGKLLNS